MIPGSARRLAALRPSSRTLLRKLRFSYATPGRALRCIRAGLPGIRRAGSFFAALACVFSLTTGCADFEHLNNSKFDQAFPPYGGGDGKKPKPDPPENPKNPDQQGPDDRKPGPCEDLDSAVIATCLDVTGGVAPISGAGVPAALVAERLTGRVWLAKKGPTQKATPVTSVVVNPAGDGGLMDIALSPSFATDGAIYAYLSTQTDNRVVRLMKETGPKDVLTGIPHGANGNAGSIAFGPGGTLYVLTGNAGNEAAANDPGSLAGKILRVDSDELNAGAPVTPNVVLSGLGFGGSLCFDPADFTLWYTNRSPVKDELLRLPKGASAPQLVWSWPDRPGVSGCAVSKSQAIVALRDSKQLVTVTLPPGASGPVAPAAAAIDGAYGLLGDVSASSDGTLCFGTVNKLPAGDPKDVDDRVVCIAGGGGGDDSDPNSPGKKGPPGFGVPSKPKDD